MVNVCFAGLTGWTARPIVRAINEANDLVLTAGVSRSAAGRSLGEFGGSDAGSVYATVVEALEAAEVDVLVDYTSATAVRQHVEAAVDAGVHVVVGSSGLSAEDYADLDRRARQQGVGVFAAGNFSVMAAVLLRAAQVAAQHLDHWEILDYASKGKHDVPSGTSRELAEALAQLREPRGAVPLRSCTGQSRREAPRWAARASTRCACPASWSARRSSLVAPESASSCATTRARVRSPTSTDRCWRSAGSRTCREYGGDWTP